MIATTAPRGARGERRAPASDRAAGRSRAPSAKAIAGAAPPSRLARPLRMSWSVGALRPRRAGVLAWESSVGSHGR